MPGLLARWPSRSFREMRIGTFIVAVVVGVGSLSGCGDDGAADVSDDTRDTSVVPDQIDDGDLTEVEVDSASEVDGEPSADASDADDSHEVGPDVSDTEDPLDGADVADVADVADGVDDVPDVDIDAEVAPDTSTTLPLPGFGTISGECGVIDTELADPAPSFFVNAIDFGTDPYDEVDFARLLPDSQEMIRDGNAGGSSVMSEVFALEVLERCELATLIATETEIVYDQQGKITDILMEIDDEKVGVSVTRAVGFPFDAPYTVAQAKSILEKKLGDILISSANVSAPYRWVKQILHVLAYDAPHVDSLRTAWGQIATATRADTIIMVTVTNGADAFIY